MMKAHVYTDIFILLSVFLRIFLVRVFASFLEANLQLLGDPFLSFLTCPIGTPHTLKPYAVNCLYRLPD